MTVLLLRWILLIGWVGSGWLTVQGQVFFSGTLLGQGTGTPIPYAHIFSPEHDAHALTDEMGHFQLALLHASDSIDLVIEALGVEDTQRVRCTPGRQTIYLQQPPTQLEAVELQGLSARQVVLRAVRMIPQNYAVETYGTWGFYRQYHRVNGTYRNLLEAQVLLHMQTEQERNQLVGKEAFSIPRLRRSAFVQVTGDERYGGEILSLMEQNPIYHLYTSSLHPARIAQYQLSFDTITDQHYVIHYESSLWTSDPHGISNYTEVNLTGEAREEGTLKIDRASYAILRYVRRVYRNATYNYPRLNNFLLPSRRYRTELVRGVLIAEYDSLGGKWFPQRLLHSFTNDYRDARMGTKAYRVEENYEWHSHFVTRQMDDSWDTPFYYTPYLTHLPYTYNEAEWQRNLPNFFFGIEELIYQDLREAAGDQEVFLPEVKEEEDRN